MKKIVILNGAGKKNGNTAAMINAFKTGAAGNEVTEFYLQTMKIHGCLDCGGCRRKEKGSEEPCVQKDDMEKVNEAYLWADVIVFASPMYWGTVSGQLKVCIDRLYAVQNKIGYADMSKQYKETAFIMTARGGYYQQALDFYHIFTDVMGWKNWGSVLGKDKEDDAKALGKSIK